MSVAWPVFTLGSGTEHRGHVIVNFDVRLAASTDNADLPAFACKCVLEIFLRLTTFLDSGSLLRLKIRNPTYIASITLDPGPRQVKLALSISAIVRVNHRPARDCGLNRRHRSCRAIRRLAPRAPA